MCACVLVVVLLKTEGGPVRYFLSVTIHISLCTTDVAHKSAQHNAYLYDMGSLGAACIITVYTLFLWAVITNAECVQSCNYV